MSTGRGERAIARQLADMEAAGLGGPEGVDPATARREIAKAARGPQWRERWRLAVGAVLLVGGIALWLTGHLLTVPGSSAGTGSPVDLDPEFRAVNARLLFEAIGAVAAFAGVVWLRNQIWPRRRTYDTREVVRAGITAGLLVVGVVLWSFVDLRDGLGPSVMVMLLVVTMQSSYITRTTGPDTVRAPVHDARLAMYQALTPWPVVLGVSVVFCAAQVVALLR